jgi:hypothetical protein
MSASPRDEQLDLGHGIGEDQGNFFLVRRCAVKRWRVSVLTCIAGLLAAGLATRATEPPEPKKPQDPVRAVRDKYEKLPLKVLKIAEPAEVTEVRYYKDGGSIGLELTDAKKVKHHFCFDGSKGPGPYPLLVGAIYPTREGAREVELRGPEEAELYAVLLRWARKHKHRDAFLDPKADLPFAKYGRLWETQAFFFRLERRFTERVIGVKN